MVNFNELFVSEPCLYIKIMSHERRGKEGQGAPQGFNPPAQMEPHQLGRHPGPHRGQTVGFLHVKISAICAPSKRNRQQ